MRKIMIYAVSLFLCGSAYAKGADFNGLYFGFGLGGTQAIAHGEGTLASTIGGGNTIIVEVLEGRRSAIGAEADFTAGYGQVINQKYLLGLEGTAGLHHFKIKRTSEVSAISMGASVAQFGIESTLKMSAPFAILLLKPGFLISPQTLFYGLVGTKIAGFKVKAESNHSQFVGTNVSAAASGDKNVIRAGLALGLGMERYVTDRVTLGLNYQYVYYGHSDLTASGSFDGIGGTLNITSENKLYTNALLMRFNYYV